MILRAFVPILVVGSLAFAGCRKKAEPKAEAAPPPQSAAEPVTSNNPPPSAPGQAPQPATTIPMSFPGAGEQSDVNSALTGAVARFHDKFRRLPRDWNELVTAGFIPAILEPPAGRRFAIDPVTRIVVVLPK